MPTTFNDPFEFKVAIDFNADEPTYRHRYFLDNPGTSEADYDIWRRTLDQSKWWVIQQTRAAILAEIGVLCLSAIEDNHLMWSHYASNHQGFCVGFDENQLIEVAGVVWCKSITYQHEAPIFRFFYDAPDEFASKAVTYKSHLWAYEQEYRMLTDKSGIFTFPKSAMQQVILGCRAFPELRNYADMNCEITKHFWFQMCEDFSAYKLLKRPIVKDKTLMSSFF